MSVPEHRSFSQHEAAYGGTSLTFCRVDAVERASDLANADIVIVGAPFDLGTSFRPGTRYGPDSYRVIHFDTHADTAIYQPGMMSEHAAPFYRAVTEGKLRGQHLVQSGPRRGLSAV